MSQAKVTDGMLQEWGTRLFFGMPKKGKKLATGGSSGSLMSASSVRKQVRAAVLPGAKQVMVKITGGGKGMKPVAAHFRYISRQGKDEVGGPGKTLELEDELGSKLSGANAIKDLEYDWQMAGGFIPDTSHRREVFNIMLSMPAGTPPDKVLGAARAFAHETFNGHKFVFVMHNDTKSPHVHLAVRAERKDGVRLNPRKADLQGWRELFAARLQDRGIDAVATRASTRNVKQAPKPIWQIHEDGNGGKLSRRAIRNPESVEQSRIRAIEAWGNLERALGASEAQEDKKLSLQVAQYVKEHFGGPQLTPSNLPRPGRTGPAPSVTR